MVKTLSIALLAGTFALVGSAFGQGSDNAANYGGGWTNGSNGGSGFAAWDLTDNNNAGGANPPFAGYFIGTSTAGTGINIDTSGVSFGIYANPNGAFATARRGFASPLQTGQQFSLILAVNFTDGAKGLSLTAGGTDLFTFNVSNTSYTINGLDTGLTYLTGGSVFSIGFVQTSPTGGTYSVARGTSTFSGTYTGLASGFRAYNSNTTGGDANNLYFNNLALTAVPEPTALSLVAIGGVAGTVSFIRRRRA